MKEECGNCIHFHLGCELSPDPNKRARPYRDSPCLWVNSDGKTAFEPKPEPTVGKVIVGYETDPSPAMGVIFSPQPPPDENPLSLVVAGGRKFWVDKDGNAFANNKDRTPLGKAEDLMKQAEDEETKKWIDEKLKEKQEW